MLRGALTFVPGSAMLLPKPRPTPHSVAPYYYGVWLKHLALLGHNGLDTAPRRIAELGPGSSLGVGLAALLCGSERYYALDILAYTDPRKNVALTSELVALLAARTPRPDKGFPSFQYCADGSLFPHEILTDERLAQSLDAERLLEIRAALQSRSGKAGSIEIAYRVPWHDETVTEENTLDLVLSQSVLEHVDDLRTTYRALYKWLKPGGVLSSLIDFRSHGLTAQWNGHWGVPEGMWKVARGRRSFLINRAPWSAHEAALAECGFELIYLARKRRPDGLARHSLARRWQTLSDDDLYCELAFVQAIKPSGYVA